MKRPYKNIFSIFLLITGLVIFSHSVIPHDHHYNIVSENTHDEHQEHDQSGDEPVHCHFFNNIVVSKITNSSLLVVKSISLSFFLVSEFKFKYLKKKIAKNSYYQACHFVKYLFVLEDAPTRGSPSK